MLGALIKDLLLFVGLLEDFVDALEDEAALVGLFIAGVVEVAVGFVRAAKVTF